VRYIRPRRPEQNGKVERSHRIDEEKFWGRYAGHDFDAATAALAGWNTGTTTNASRWPCAAAHRWRS
jgi:hypothetical protein